MTSPIYTEQWTYPPLVPATVPAGAPLPPPFREARTIGRPGAASRARTQLLASEVWAMAGGYASYPIADPTARPPSMFRIYDPQRPLELMTVTDTRTAPNWTVFRADEGSPGQAHRPGFTVRPFITTRSMGSIAHGVATRNGLVRRSVLTAPYTLPQMMDTAQVVAELFIPGGEAIPGSVYEAVVWGYVTPTSSNWGAPGDTNNYPRFACGTWFDNPARRALGSIDAPVGPALASGAQGPPNCRFRIQSIWNLYGSDITPSGVCYTNLWTGANNNMATAITAFMFGATGTPYNTTVDGTFRLTIDTGPIPADFPNTPPTTQASVTVQGATISRTA